MKTYISKISQEKYSKTYGTTKVIENIYRVINNIPNFIGEVEYNTGSFRGRESVIYNFLIENKYIPKKAVKFSVTEWRGSGYYVEDNPYCKIVSL